MAIDPSYIASALGGAASFGSNIFQADQAKKQQRREMKWQEDFWNKQNLYNSPQAQMKRLQEAGLNPNLVYGGSSGGTAGTAEMMKVPDMDPSGLRAIDAQGTANVLSSIYDFDVKQAQTDNLKSQTQVNHENALFKATQTYGEGIRNARSKLDLNLAEDLYHTSAEYQKESLRKLQADTKMTLQTARNRLHEEDVKKLDSRLAKLGIRPSDDKYARLFVSLAERLLNKYGKKYLDFWKGE